MDETKGKKWKVGEEFCNVEPWTGVSVSLRSTVAIPRRDSVHWRHRKLLQRVREELCERRKKVLASREVEEVK